MSVEIVSFRVIRCDHEGCGQKLEDTSISDATAMRIRSAGEGWSYRPKGSRGVLSADFCPTHHGDADNEVTS